MTTIEELKKAILWAETEGKECEDAIEWVDSCSSEFSEDARAEFVKDARRFRIAAACMWEKLERMERGGQA